LLGHLREQEGLSNADLADRLYVTRPSVSALLERLERGGFIRREVSPNDRRGINIWLEPRGREVSESLREETRAYLGGLFEGLNDAEIASFRDSIEKFVASGRDRRAKDLAAESASNT
jgi:DNA-binding MarR family transcriptional regulator